MKNSKPFEWTIKSDNYLTTHWPLKNAEEIGQELGISRYAVSRRALKLGIREVTTDGSRPQYYDWSEDQDERLKTHFKTKSNKELAEMLGVSKQAVMRRMKKLSLSRGNDGIAHHKWNSEEESRFVTMYEAAASFSQLADALGISIQTAKRKAKSLQLKGRNHWDEARYTQLARSYAAGCTLAEIAEDLDVSVSTVKRKIKVLKLKR